MEADHPHPTGPLVPGETGGAGEARLVLSEVELPAVVEIGAWPNCLEVVSTRLGEIIGTSLPGRPGRFCEGGDALLGWVAFGRFLWLSANGDDVARLEGAFETDEASVVDLVSARNGVRLTGDVAPELLNKAVAIDFDLRAFPPGSLAQTVIHEVPVVILRRTADSFDLLSPSSFAETISDWLRDAALEFGYRVDDPVKVA
jgi:heterotetrameric sarcosine oxidase gamma subunit